MTTRQSFSTELNRVRLCIARRGCPWVVLPHPLVELRDSQALDSVRTPLRPVLHSGSWVRPRQSVIAAPRQDTRQYHNRYWYSSPHWESHHEWSGTSCCRPTETIEAVTSSNGQERLENEQCREWCKECGSGHCSNEQEAFVPIHNAFVQCLAWIHFQYRSGSNDIHACKMYYSVMVILFERRIQDGTCGTSPGPYMFLSYTVMKQW